MLTPHANSTNIAPPCDRNLDVADLAMSLFRELDHEQQITYLSDLRRRVNTSVHAAALPETVAEII